jgi:hypothetical protein
MMAETTKKLTVSRTEAQQYYGEIEPLEVSVVIQNAEMIAQGTKGKIVISDCQEWKKEGYVGQNNGTIAIAVEEDCRKLKRLIFDKLSIAIQHEVEKGLREITIDAKAVMRETEKEIAEYNQEEAKEAKEREKQAALREAEEETWAKDAKEFVKRLEAGEWDPVIRTKSSGDMSLIDSTYYRFDSDRGKSAVLAILKKTSEPVLLRKLLEKQTERIKQLLEKIEEMEQPREFAKEEILREIAEEGGFSLTEESKVSYRVEEDE